MSDINCEPPIIYFDVTFILQILLSNSLFNLLKVNSLTNLGGNFPRPGIKDPGIGIDPGKYYCKTIETEP